MCMKMSTQRSILRKLYIWEKSFLLVKIEQVVEEFEKLVSGGKLRQAEELIVKESQGREDELADWLRFIGIENGNSKNHFIALHCFQAAKKIAKLESIKEETMKNLSIAHSNYAKLLENAKKFREAEKHYIKAIEINPRNAIVHYNYANLLENKGRLGEATKHYIEAMYINPELSKLYKQMHTETKILVLIPSFKKLGIFLGMVAVLFAVMGSISGFFLFLFLGILFYVIAIELQNRGIYV